MSNPGPEVPRLKLRRRRWLAVAFGIAFGLVSFEVVLQVAAYLIFRQELSEDVGDAGDRVILCVGDSFTYGLGASSESELSYPAQLQRLLAERPGPTWQVHNGGWSGRDSAAVLRRFCLLEHPGYWRLRQKTS